MNDENALILYQNKEEHKPTLCRDKDDYLLLKTVLFEKYAEVKALEIVKYIDEDRGFDLDEEVVRDLVMHISEIIGMTLNELVIPIQGEAIRLIKEGKMDANDDCLNDEDELYGLDKEDIKYLRNEMQDLTVRLMLSGVPTYETDDGRIKVDYGKFKAQRKVN